jgi:hypothetical protein
LKLSNHRGKSSVFTRLSAKLAAITSKNMPLNLLSPNSLSIGYQLNLQL